MKNQQNGKITLKAPPVAPKRFTFWETNDPMAPNLARSRKTHVLVFEIRSHLLGNRAVR
jgi:hypothetical protein